MSEKIAEIENSATIEKASQSISTPLTWNGLRDNMRRMEKREEMLNAAIMATVAKAVHKIPDAIIDTAGTLARYSPTYQILVQPLVQRAVKSLPSVDTVENAIPLRAKAYLAALARNRKENLEKEVKVNEKLGISKTETLEYKKNVNQAVGLVAGPQLGRLKKILNAEVIMECGIKKTVSFSIGKLDSSVTCAFVHKIADRNNTGTALETLIRMKEIALKQGSEFLHLQFAVQNQRIFDLAKRRFEYLGKNQNPFIDIPLEFHTFKIPLNEKLRFMEKPSGFPTHLIKFYKDCKVLPINEKRLRVKLPYVETDNEMLFVIQKYCYVAGSPANGEIYVSVGWTAHQRWSHVIRKAQEFSKEKGKKTMFLAWNDKAISLDNVLKDLQLKVLSVDKLSQGTYNEPFKLIEIAVK